MAEQKGRKRVDHEMSERRERVYRGREGEGAPWTEFGEGAELDGRGVCPAQTAF